MNEIKLGDVVRDTVTGFKGMVVAITQWLNGCRRLTVQPQELTNEGKPKDAEAFDELQLAVVSAKKHVPETATGGPRDDRKVARRPTVKR